MFNKPLKDCESAPKVAQASTATLSVLGGFKEKLNQCLLAFVASLVKTS
jgi:hypothetical protein